MNQLPADEVIVNLESAESAPIPDGNRSEENEPAWKPGPVTACLTAVCIVSLIPVVFFSLIALLGRSNWMIELTTHFRFQYFYAALFLLLAFLLLRRTRPAMVAGVLVLLNGLFVLPVYAPVEIPEERTRSIRILFSNVYVENKDYESVRRLVRETQPDIIFFAEVHRHWPKQLNQLKSEYPHAVIYRFQGKAAIAGYSRIKLKTFEMKLVGEPPVPVIVAQTQLDGHPIRIIGVHVESPGDAASLQARMSQMQHLAEITGQREMPTAIIGDLNVSPWSPFFTDLLQQGKLRDSRSGFGNHATWETGRPLLRIPIDHCLVSEEIVVERREICRNVGSDHFPLLVELSVATQKQTAAQHQSETANSQKRYATASGSY